MGALVRGIGETIENTIGISGELSLIIGFLIALVIIYLIIKQ